MSQTNQLKHLAGQLAQLRTLERVDYDNYAKTKRDH